ncbi:hypothetical protein HII31_11213 [Pseudocercospora fuligena]|uniref:Uncharacterized protein n=1 Tax=Pseudocercospora fuligena TaxID=685502 RepID=A0A8H6RAG7_9PEZI|nr:hypothetical protein HII31_11213 [Pseudocercospora fuligena]
MGAAHSIFGHNQRPVSSSYVTKQPDGRIYKCTTIQLCCKPTDVVSPELRLESLTLEDRVQSLPQELQDMIFNFVVEVPSHDTIVVDESYRAPAALWLNKPLRTTTAQKYFTTNAFAFKNMSSKFFDEWVDSLDPDHCALLKDTRFEIYDQVSGDRVQRAMAMTGWLNDCIKHLDENYPEVQWMALKADWRVGKTGKVEWRSWTGMSLTYLRMYLRGLDV